VGQYLLRRMVQLVPVLLVVTLVTFVIALLLPGDPALAYLGEYSLHNKVAYQAVRRELGLDRPIPVQYAMWLARALQGDLGRSVLSREPVLRGLQARFPITLELMVLVLLLAPLVAIPVGILSAVRPNSKEDVAGTILAIGGAAVPDFWLGILLIYAFGLGLRILPVSGYVPLSAGGWENIKSMLLPATTLGVYLMAILTRQMRSSLLSVLQQEYVTVARAKGLRDRAIVGRHALRNALFPVVTVIGLQTGRMLGGAVIVETIFALPGLGRAAADAVLQRDFPMLQGVVLIAALAVVMANLVTDVCYALLDPRVRFS